MGQFFKYHFNPVILGYDRIEISRKEKYKFLFKIISAMSLFFCLIYVIFQLQLYRRTEQLKSLLKEDYAMIIQNMQKLDKIYLRMEQNNQMFANAFYDIEVFPVNVLIAGSGGKEFTRELDHLEFNKLAKKLDVQIEYFTMRLEIQKMAYQKYIQSIYQKIRKVQWMPLLNPVQEKKVIVGSPFGLRKHPILRFSRQHEGIDIEAEHGSNVYASGSGKVLKAEYEKGFGNHIIIDHGYSYTSVYAHLSKIIVKKGQKVDRSEKIGCVGNSGLSTNAHLHFEIRVNHFPVNPQFYLFENIAPEDYRNFVEKFEKDFNRLTFSK